MRKREREGGGEGDESDRREGEREKGWVGESDRREGERTR